MLDGLFVLAARPAVARARFADDTAKFVYSFRAIAEIVLARQRGTAVGVVWSVDAQHRIDASLADAGELDADMVAKFERPHDRDAIARDVYDINIRPDGRGVAGGGQTEGCVLASVRIGFADEKVRQRDGRRPQFLRSGFLGFAVPQFRPRVGQIFEQSFRDGLLRRAKNCRRRKECHAQQQKQCGKRLCPPHHRVLRRRAFVFLFQ